TEILLAHDAVLIDDEGHDAGDVVLGWPGDQREAAGHLAVDDVAPGAAGHGRALRLEDLEEVTVVRRRLLPPRRGVGASFGRLCKEFPDGPPFLSVRRRPVQPVLLALVARDGHRIEPGALAVVRLLGISALRGDVGAAGVDGGQLVASDAPVEDLLLARRGV